MKKTFLIFLVLLCVATMAVSTVSAASDDIASDLDTSLALNDNAIESVSSTDNYTSIGANDHGTNGKSLGATNVDSEDGLNEENTVKSVSNLGDGEGTANVIYVAATGSDENDGSSQATAVASIGKAIQIANGSAVTDHTIYVGNGDYQIEKLESPEGKNIALIGESKEGTIVHGTGAYAINVYQDAVNWTIENFTFCDYNTSGSNSAYLRCFAADSNLLVNNCIFRNIGSKNGAIYITSTGTRRISNCLFENNYGTYSSTSSIIHLYGEGQVTLDNIEIKGSYMDPSVGTATYLRSLIYADQAQTNVVLMNSRIHDNNGSIGSIIEAKGVFKVINTTIENNYINYSANGVNGGTYMFWSGTTSNSASNINITQSVIKDNILAGGSVGLFNLVYGTHNIDKSVIMNNKYANGNDVPIGSISGATLTADYNYWGTNERPNTRVSNWVILTADVPEYAFVGVAESIPLYLNTYNTTAGETGDVSGMPDVSFDVTYALNQANPSTVTIANGQGAIDYNAVTDGDETITLSSGDAFSFEVNADVSTLIYVDGSVATTGTGTSESPFKTIAEALNIAADGKIIVIRSGTYTESDLVIDDAITVKADKGANVIIDADSEGRVFTVTSTATLRDLSLTGGMSNGLGGAIYVNGGSLTLNNVNISDCGAGSGGAIGTTAGSNLTVINSEFSENIAMYGGAIYVAGEANISNSKFADHEYGTYGGAIYINTTSPIEISSNTFTNNDADKGEAIYIENGVPSLSGNAMGDETIYLAGGSLKTILTFLGGRTVNADFGETLDLTATLTSEDGNTVKGGTVTFTANGDDIATIDLSGNNELKTTYTVPSDASGDITISGSYSLDNAGTVVSGIVHPAISYWFIDGAGGYETLAQAIDTANAGDVIYYDLPDDYTETINGKTLSKAVTIKNNGTGVVTLDANKSKVFTVSADVELNNLKFINGANTVGGFISQSSSNLTIKDCTFRDVSSTSNGAAITTSYGNLNIDGCLFENITGKQGVVYYSGTSGVLNIDNSAFNNITGTYDGWVISTGAVASISNTNFTNLVSTQASNSGYYGAVYTTKEMNVTGCLFKDITGPKGAAIYSSGPLHVNESVFDSISTTISVIYASNSGSNINYNLFINNENAKKIIESSYADANYNFWGSNEKPSTTLVSSSLYNNWTVVELSSDVDTVYMGTTADINVKFVGTNGNENITLGGIMPEYAFDLSATSGTINSSVTVVNNEATATFTPASEGTVTITATPGPAELELNVMDTSALLVVSTDGSNTNPGTLESPYATIEHALSQVTETRNIIYLLNKGEDYTESDLAVSGNVIIRGEDNAVTIDAENDGRVFIVTGTLTLEDLTLTGGMTNDAGGAILVNGGNLTVNNVNISDCGAGSGGAIATTAGSNLTVSSSVISDNMAMYGGAIYVGGEAQITDSQFNDHEYGTYGGAIYVNTTDAVTISSNTFNGNDADKGEAIYIENGAVSLSENTMADAETIFLKGGSVNSILIFLSNSTVNGEFGESVTLAATLTDDQGNTIKGGNVVFTANGETIATIDNSGSNALQTTYTIPETATGDILISGSFSMDNGGIVATGIVHPAISYWFIEGGSGYETLAQAVAAANAGDVIYGAPGTYTVNGLAINKAISIKANESGAITLDGNGNKIFNIGSDVTLINLTFTNGDPAGSANGGLISMSSGSLNVYNSTFKDTVMSTSSTKGAAIYAYGDVLISGCEFRNLTARQGAAIWQQASGASVNIEDSSFDMLNGTYDGATIKLNGPSSIMNSNFTNIAGAPTSGEYGNIYSGSGNLTVVGCNFINISGPQGAAIYFTSSSGSVLNVTKSLFENVTCLSKGIIYSTKESYINYNAFLNVNEGVNITSSYLGNGNIDYNYWGTNENASTLIKTYELSNWVLMTVTPDTLDSISSGATQTFTVDFTHYTDGTANYTLADTIPELTVSASAIKGQLDQSEIETVGGQAVFTYTGSQNGEETITFTNANVAVPVTFVVGEGYFGTVYVSKEGNDENLGSQEAPVATIARAVEIAKIGSGQICINEGVYNENNVTINSTIPISISGLGNVVIDGSDLSSNSIFIVRSGEFTVENIVFKNNKAQYGAAIDIRGQSASNLLDLNVTVNNCSFDNLEATKQGGAIYVYYTKGNLAINNSNFTNSIASGWGGALTVAYSAYENALNLEIDNCIFDNNSGNNGGAAYLMANTISISNSNFTNNNATYYPGALYFYNCTATMDNCIVENSSASRSAAAISVVFVKDQPITSLTITNSIIQNNVGRDDENAPAIFVDRATLNVSNSVLLNALDVNVSTQTGYGAVDGQGLAILNNNWWGSNDNPSTLVMGNVSENITLDNWVIMNVDPTETTGYTGEAVEIAVDFKHTNSTDGTIANLEGGLPQEFTVNANAANGTLDKTTVTTTDLEAKFKFTPEFDGENIVNVYTDESTTVPVTIMVTEKYAGPIYVTKDGDDENEGSEESPVTTIAKAIELAQGRSGQIIIGEGTYTESNLTISGDLNITAIGDVIWDANGQRAFSMSTGDVNIANVTFINGNSTSYGHLIRVDGDSLSFDDCKFISNGGDVGGTNGIIYVNLASAKFNNCLFENNTAGTGTSFGIISLKDSVLIVDGCTFTNNYNKNGCIYVSGSNIGSMAIINNTKFIGNNATSASGGQGGAIYASGSTAYQFSNGTVRPGAPSTVYVVDCEFINNTAYGGTYYSAEGGAIFVNANATAYITDSKFINNSAVDSSTGKVGRGGAIAALTGNVQISNCVFENNIATNGSTISMKYGVNNIDTHNRLNISNSVIIGSGDKLIASDYTNSSLVANNNWWGANENPSDKVTEGITVDTWTILTADPSEISDAHVGEAVAITSNFRHTNSTDGTIGELTGDFPELTVYGYALDDGEITESNITEENVATLYYTPEELGETTVYAVAGNAMVPIKITVVEAPQPVAEIIYVSTSGNDVNNGSEESPVFTIAHAVELAGAETGSGIVVIEEGVYNENGIVINTTKPISITGNGTVIIRGNNHVVNGNGAGLVLGEVSESTSIIIVNNTGSVVIKNIQFKDNNASNGGAILINADTSRILKTVNVTIDNCTFTNLQGRDGGAIYGTYINGTVIIKDSNFTANTATSWGGAVSMEYSAYDNDCLKFEVSGSIFENNTANNGGALYLMAQDITIKDTSIVNNNATYYPGALYLQNCTALIDNCTISNNSAKYDKAAIAIHGATISYETREVNPANVTITNCIIENNIGREKTAPAIYLENSNLNMSYSSVVNDMNINNTVTATYGDEKPGLVVINNNWWGTNDPSTTIFGTNITMDNWVIMNAEPNATEVQVGDEVKVTVDFNHVNTTAGEIEELTGGVIPKETYTVGFTVDNGTIAPETLNVARGESGEVIFTSANSNALITATSENAVANILILVGEQPEPFTGVVYVSKDGDDANEGSEDEPVATIAKAIEIASAEFGSGQIVIKEGTYNEYGFNITKDLTITGEGNVIIDAENENQEKLFNIAYGSGVSNFELHNLVLNNGNANYGAAVYSYASNLVLDNITIAGNENTNSRLIVSNGNMTVKNSLFANNTVSGIITQGGNNNNITIINTTFEGNNVTNDQSIFGVVHINGAKGLAIEDSKFYNNLVRQTTVSGYTGTDISVKGSEFINNTADNTPYYSSGGAIRAQAKLDVTESVFINNNARRQGGAIYVGSNGQATITKSEFINNSVYSDEFGDAIYNEGNTTISYCIFLTNGTRYVVYNTGSEDSVVNAQYNWWGTNDNPQGLVGSGTWEDYWADESGDCQPVDVSNWIVMSVDVDTENVETGASLPVTVDFKHYLDENGEAQELADSLAQELVVSFESETGTFDDTELTTTQQVATTNYNVVSGLNNLTVKSSDAIVSREFKTQTIVTNLTVVADPVLAGDVVVVNVTLVDADGNGIDGTVIVTVNGSDKEVTVTAGAGSAEFTGLAVGDYDISAKFDATDIYAEATATGSVSVSIRESNLTIAADPVLAGDVVVVNVTLVDADGNGIDGTVIVTVNGSDKEVTVTAGAGSAEFTGLAVGDYDISAKFDATDIYAEATATGSVSVSIRESNLHVVADPIIVGDVAIVNVTLVDADGNGIDGTVIVSVNGSDKEVTVVAGAGSAEFTGLAVGNYDISAKFEETPIYAESTATSTLVVTDKELIKTNVSVSAEPITAGDVAVVNVTLVDADGNGIDGTVLVTVNGSDKEATVVAGAGSVEFEGLVAGTYDIHARFDATDDYNSSDATGSLTISPKETTLTIVADSVLAGDVVVVNVTLVDADGVGVDGTVIVTVNGSDKEVTVTAGAGSAEFTGLAVGDYDISAKFDATDIYAEATATGSVSVSIRESNLTIAADPVLAGDAVVVNVTLVDADGNGIDGTVIVSVNGSEKEVTVTAGAGSAEFTGLAVGNYDISAKFDATDIYAEATATGSVSVSIRESNLTIAADPVLAGDAVVVNVTLVDADGNGIDGTVIVTVNGTDKEVTVTAGAGSVEFEGLAAGTYDISAKFDATDIYAEATATGSVSVSIRETTLHVVADPIIVGDVAVVNVTLVDADGNGIDGTVIVSVNGTDKEVTVTAGAGSAEFTGLAAGTYDISAKFDATEIYDESTATGSLVVTDKELVKTTLNVVVEPAVAGDAVVVNVTLVDADGNGIDGTVIVSVNGTDKEVTVTAGAGSAEFTGLAAGTYDISAKFEATEDYNSSDATGSLTISPKETTLTVSTDPAVAGDAVVVNVTLVDADGNGIDGTVIVSVNGTDKEVTVTAGAGSAEFTGLAAGTYDISAKFEATEDYNSSDATGSLTISPKETTLTVNADPAVAGDAVVVNVTLVDADGNGIDGTVIVTVNGSDKEVTVTAGAGSAEFTGLAAGTYDISAKFEATGDYDASEATGSLVVEPKESKLSIVVDDVVTGESSKITATLTDADGNPLNGTVNVTVNGKEYPIEVVDGKGSVSTDPFEEIGTTDVVAKFDGDENMAPVEVESQITTYGPGNVTVKHTDAGDVADIQAAIDAANPGDIVRLGNYDYADVADVNITKDVTIAGSEGTTITSAADGTPIFNIPAKSENGPESVNITGVDFKLNNGDTVVKATADNDTENPLSIVTPNININNNTFETVNDTTVPESITVLELDSERGVLSPTSEIAVSGNTLTAGVNPFEFEVTSVASGEDINIVPQKVVPEKQATVIVYNNMSTRAIGPTDGRTGDYFYFNLTDINGKPIANTPMQIGFNGKVYDYEHNNISTNENGTAKLQINLGYKGDYTFAICFLGDEKYNASFAVAVIKVDVQKAKLTVPNKSYKANAKTKTLTATFKTEKGNPIVGKSVKFTVNGKTYSAKTNDKGVATVKVSLNKKGTYNFTVKYGGDSTYAAVTQKAKLTIK